MDLITQGIIGSALAVAVSDRQHMKSAAIIGALGGLAPDMDVFIRSGNDPLLSLDYHRHFTHSLFFIPIGGVIVASAYWGIQSVFKRYYKKPITFKKIALFSTLGVATHGLLDTCTSYGTRLLWPFITDRLAWNVVSIIDPIFTILLLIGLVISLRKQTNRPMQIAVSLALLYIGFGATQHYKAKQFMIQVAADRGHYINRHFIDTTLGNTIVWRSLYESDHKLYIDAVRIPLTGAPKLYAGDTVSIDIPDSLSTLTDPWQRDLNRFTEFTQNYVYYDSDSPERVLIGDMRYSRTVLTADPLWALQLNLDSPDKPVTFRRLVSEKPFSLTPLFRMILGK